jgi:HlyD family secretion protein
MKKLITVLLVLLAVGAGAGAFYMRRTRPEPSVTTMPVSRGDVVDVVAATGTLEAVTTVDVGTQVSGLVQEMYADFNSIVRRDQVIARLDPSLIQTRIEQNRASVTRAEADVERLKVTLADAVQKLDRAKQMSDRQLIPRTELETAEVNVKSAEAQIKSSEAALIQARANLQSEEVNLGHTVIKSPIDGIVISRSVDPGQTVAASMNAPVLYQIAADLTKMQVLANIDEADVGRMRPGQHVTFRVDAYPTDTFTGNVEQVRLQPTVVQNVVVYSTVIAVPNPQLKLKPGMTAQVSIEVARQNNVLRVPTAALRFRPTEQMFQVLNQEVPPEVLRGAGRGSFAGGRGGRGREGAGGPGAPGGPVDGPSAGSGAPASAQQAPAVEGRRGGQPEGQRAGAAPGQGQGGRPESAEARGGGDGGGARQGGVGGGRGGFDPNMSPEERRKRMEERMASMSPEERERFQARMKERMAQGGGGSGPGGPGGQDQPNAAGGGRGGQSGRSGSRGIVGGVSAGASITSGASTIDSLFAPLTITESRGRVWLFVNKQLKPINIRLGVSDGTYSQLIGGDLTEDQEVVTNMVTGLEPTNRPGGQQGTGNPLMGPQRGGPGGGRGPGGGGGRGF